MRFVLIAFVALSLVPALLPAAARAQAPAAATDPGMELYKTAGVDCELCHGWHGYGRSHDTTFSDVIAAGPALQTSKMTRAQMIEIITCGKMTEGRISVMPYYRNDAWTRDVPCYGGKVRNDIPFEQFPLPGVRQLTAAQAELVADFVLANLVNKEPTLDYCRRYFSHDPTVCEAILDPNPPAAAPAPGAGGVVRPGQPAAPAFRLPGTP